MTKHHCSYCDVYRVGPRVKATIDHFRPKSSFPRDAYRWGNLLLACMLCQERNNQFDDRLLKPDEKGYRFEDYFTIDWTTGRLEAVGKEGEERHERAKKTLELFHLNDNGKPDDRLYELETYTQFEGDRPPEQ